MARSSNRNLNNPFIALGYRNFRVYWLGMCVSFIGSWMQNTAQPWLAYSLTDSPLLLSLVSMLQFMPMLLFSLFAGVVVDRLPKKRLLLITQSASLAVTFVLAVLVSTGAVMYWHLLVSATVLGIVNTLDMPVRQAFVVELVGREHLMNAIALNSTVVNIARILGPAIAGILMGAAGIAACFYINSLSFLAVIVSLFFIKPNEEHRPPPVAKKLLASLKEGLLYIRHTPALLRTLIALLVVSLFAMNYNVLVPVFAQNVLHQQETGFGFLMAFAGAGSFIGALFVAAASKRGPSRFVLRYFPLFLGALIVLSGVTNVYFIVAFGLAASGFCFVAYASTANSSLQLTTRNEYRGRVMSVYTWVFFGSTPAGNLFAGAIAEHWGSPAGFLACGVATGLPFALWFLWKFIRKRQTA